ncbi:DMP19 family protein [Myroides sp. LJL119]
MREFPNILISQNAMMGDSQDIINSNISVINFLRGNSVNDDELHPDAFASYCVDYFNSILQQEGLASFVHKTKWDLDLIEIIHAGLIAIADKQYIDYFEMQMRKIKALSKIKLSKFLEKPYATDKELMAIIQDDSFKNIPTDLVLLNAQWLKNHPDLKVCSLEDMQKEIQEFLL